MIQDAKEWLKTLAVAPPFSKRRRELIFMTKEIARVDAWVEAKRPE